MTYMNSVRGRLLLLLLGLAAAFFSASGGLLVYGLGQSREQLLAQLQSTARVLSGAVDRQLAEAGAVARTLASDPDLRDGRWAAFHARTVALGNDMPGWFIVADLDGHPLLDSRLPLGATIAPFTWSPETKARLLAGQSSTSDLLMGPRGPVIGVSVPVTVEGRKLALAYLVNANAFRAAVKAEHLPIQAVATVLDRAGRVVTRSEGASRFTGRQLPFVRLRTQKSDSGILSATSLENIATVAAYSRSPSTGWMVLVLVPEATVDRAALISILLAAAVFPLLLLFSFLFALTLSRKITTETVGLVRDAHALREGRPLGERGGELAEMATVHMALRGASEQLKLREEQQEQLINELNHRVKNTLATVQALALQSFRSQGAELQSFIGRLLAIAAAHDLLTKSNWASIDLHELAEVCLAAHRQRFDIEGEPVALQDQLPVSLAMILNELMTNSVKYGALSSSPGRVRLAWTVEPGFLVLEWVERGGPPVVAPTRLGFGSRLLQVIATRDLGGSIETDYAPEGLRVRIRFPLLHARRWSNAD